MITLIGVGHVFAISDRVKDLIRTSRPEVVCLELDTARYQGLMSRERSKRIPLQYRLLAYIQTRMADKFGTEPGDEMLAAASAAGEIGAKLALIDMDAPRVFAQLWARMSLKERVGLFTGALAGLVVSKKTVEQEMVKYEENEEQYMETLSKGFPSVKAVLIDDRNRYMASRLKELSAQYRNIVAVVGDGHVPGMLEELKSLEVQAIRLKDIRAGTARPTSVTEYTTSFWYKGE